MSEMLELTLNDVVEETLEDKLNALAEIKLDLDKKQKAFDKENAALKNSIKEMEEEIKAEVLKYGKSISTDLIYAVYTNGSEKWDGNLLKGFAMAHPEILNAMKVGSPSVTFRLKRK